MTLDRDFHDVNSVIEFRGTGNTAWLSRSADQTELRRNERKHFC